MSHATAPQTPVRSGNKQLPRTPAANRLAVAEKAVGARIERGEAAAVDAHYAQSTRAWRSGGDRKVMFDNRGGPSMIPEALRSSFLVGILRVCAWLLLAAGTTQIAASKLAYTTYPAHWEGVMLIFLGLMTMLVRVYTNRCGTKPEWTACFAVVTMLVCVACWLLADGPLYKEVKQAVSCSDNGVHRLCDIAREWDADGRVIRPKACVCRVASGARDLCVDYTSECSNIPGNRRYMLISLVSVWVGIGLSFVVALVSMRVVATTYDAAADAAAMEMEQRKQKMKMEAGPHKAPFGV